MFSNGFNSSAPSAPTSLPPRVSHRRGYLRLYFVVNLCFATFALSGCITDQLTVDKAQAWYEKKCETFEDFMAAANTAEQKGNNQKAIQYYKDGRALAEVLYGENDGRIATSSSSLAHLEETMGKFADAENDYKKALNIDKKILHWDSPETIEVRRSLARVLMTRYKEAEAKQLLAGLKDPTPTPPAHHPRRK